MDILEIAAQRRKKAAALLQKKNLTHAVICNGGREKYNAWLLGTEAPVEGPPGMGVLPTLPPFNRNTLYILDSDGNVARYSALTPHPTDGGQHPRFSAAEHPEMFSSGSIGIVNPDCLKDVTLQDMKSVCPAIQLVDISGDLDALKAQKTPEEVSVMRDAAAIFDRAFSAIKLCLRAGFSEQKAVVEFRWRLNQLGISDQDLSLLSVVRMTSSPDGGEAVTGTLTYSGRILNMGDRINFSCTSFAPGGSAALGRCYILGKASDEVKKFWQLTLDAQDVAAKSAVPGATLSQVEKAVNDFLTENGLPKDHSAFLYGIGSDRFEAPRNTDSTRDMVLSEGMTLVLAPKVCPEGKDPYCCMDVYTVQAGGAVRLGKTSRALVELC